MADSWTITAQTQREQLNAAGTNFETVMEISFQVTSGPAAGTTGQIKVPANTYNADNVKALVQEQVDTLNEVAAL